VNTEKRATDGGNLFQAGVDGCGQKGIHRGGTGKRTARWERGMERGGVRLPQATRNNNGLSSKEKKWEGLTSEVTKIIQHIIRTTIQPAVNHLPVSRVENQL